MTSNDVRRIGKNCFPATITTRREETDLAALGRKDQPGSISPSALESVPTKTPRTYQDALSRTILRDLLERHRIVAANLISRAGARKRASTQWIGPRTAISTLASLRAPIHGNRGDASVVGARICEDKALTKELLSSAGVPTPPGKRASNADEACEFATDIQSPVVVKPRFGTKGAGVSVNLADEAAIRAAFGELRFPRNGLVERYIQPIREYRIIATDRECMSVVRRVAPHVRGDGESTIGELIAKKNEHRLTNPCTADTQIPTNAPVERFLAANGLTLDTVIPAGETVLVSGVGGVSGGAEPMECLAQTDATIKDVAVAAVASIPCLKWAGVDVVVDKQGKPWVLEVNSAADISCSAYPFYGVPRDLGGAIWKRLIHRDAVSVALPTGTEREATLHASPARALPKGSKRARSFTALLQEHLEVQGKSFSSPAPGFLCLESPGPDVWFANAGTVNDLAISGAFASMHGTVMRLAASAGIPAVQSKVVRSPAEARALLEDSPKGLAMTPYRSRWRRGLSKPEVYLQKWENNEPKVGAVVMQERRVGPRLRVMATKTNILLVVGRSAVSAEAITKASELAKRTVRMIPQLNWAFVEVFLPNASSNDHSSSKDNALLEGILYSPVLLPSDLILAGSVENAMSYIVELGEASLPPYKSGNKAVKKAQRQAASLSQRARQHVRHGARTIKAVSRYLKARYGH